MPPPKAADVVAGGYLLVHRGDVPGTDGYLSASECIACQFPGYWALGWTDVDVEERQALLAHWGGDPAGFGALVAATTDAFEAGKIRWPAVFAAVKTARRFAARHRVTHPTLTLIGLGIRRRDVDAFLADGEDDGFTAAAAQPVPLAGGGEDAGWEVLADDGGSFHSWHCHPDLEAQVARRIGVVAGADGLIADAAGAEAVAAVYDADPGTEPARWLPWLVRTYPLTAPRS